MCVSCSKYQPCQPACTSARLRSCSLPNQGQDPGATGATLGHVPRALSPAARCCSRAATAAPLSSATTRSRRRSQYSSSRCRHSSLLWHLRWRQPNVQRLHRCGICRRQAVLLIQLSICINYRSCIVAFRSRSKACMLCAKMSRPLHDGAHRQQRQQASCRQEVRPPAHRAKFRSSAGVKAPTTSYSSPAQTPA